MSEIPTLRSVAESCVSTFDDATNAEVDENSGAWNLGGNQARGRPRVPFVWVEGIPTGN